MYLISFYLILERHVFLLCKISGIPLDKPNCKPCTVYNKINRNKFSQSPFKFGSSGIIIVESTFTTTAAAHRFSCLFAQFIVAVVIIFAIYCRRIPTAYNVTINNKNAEEKRITKYKRTTDHLTVYIPNKLGGIGM